GAATVATGPNQDLPAGEAGNTAAVANTPLHGEQLGQRVAPRQAPRTPPQGVVEGVPGLAGRFGDRAGFESGPVSRAGVPDIGPRQDFREGQLGNAPDVARPAFVRQQQGQGGATGESAPPVPQGHVRRQPGLTGGVGDPAGVGGGPGAGALIPGVGPLDNLLLGERREGHSGVVPPTLRGGVSPGSSPPQGQATGPLGGGLCTPTF